MNILNLTQVYLDILCHVTYILDTLQYDLRHHVPEQNSERSVLGHVDQGHLEQDPFVQSHSDQARLSIPDSVCSDWQLSLRLQHDCGRQEGLEKRTSVKRLMGIQTQSV